jgi:hypothetical protein
LAGCLLIKFGLLQMKLEELVGEQDGLLGIDFDQEFSEFDQNF